MSGNLIAVGRRDFALKKRCYVCDHVLTRLCRCGELPAYDAATRVVRCPCGDYNPRDFGRNRFKWDLCGSECNECKNAKMRQWRRSSAGQANMRRRDSEAAKRYRRSERGRAIRDKNMKDFKVRRGAHLRAIYKVQNAVRYGGLRKPETCERCHAKAPRIYMKILNDRRPIRGISWLCPLCHRRPTSRLCRANGRKVWIAEVAWLANVFGASTFTRWHRYVRPELGRASAARHYQRVCAVISAAKIPHRVVKVGFEDGMVIDVKPYEIDRYLRRAAKRDGVRGAEPPP